MCAEKYAAIMVRMFAVTPPKLHGRRNSEGEAKEEKINYQERKNVFFFAK